VIRKGKAKKDGTTFPRRELSGKGLGSSFWWVHALDSAFSISCTLSKSGIDKTVAREPRNQLRCRGFETGAYQNVKISIKLAGPLSHTTID
jgi:hypothetical protein